MTILRAYVGSSHRLPYQATTQTLHLLALSGRPQYVRVAIYFGINFILNSASTFSDSSPSQLPVFHEARKAKVLTLLSVSGVLMT